MTIFRVCRFFHSLPVFYRSFAHLPKFGPHSKQTYQMFREIKEWQLAKFLSQSSLEPNSILSTFFCEDIVRLEGISKKTMHSSITGRMWDAISPKKLERLYEAYTQAIQDTMLKTYSEQEIEEMLHVYDQKETISPKLSARLEQVYKLHKRAIDTVLKHEAESIRGSWMPELIEAAKNEGIKFRK
jgi:hypothetical protein